MTVRKNRPGRLQNTETVFDLANGQVFADIVERAPVKTMPDEISDREDLFQ